MAEGGPDLAGTSIIEGRGGVCPQSILVEVDTLLDKIDGKRWPYGAVGGDDWRAGLLRALDYRCD